MKRSNILLAFVATGALVAGPAFAKQSRNETGANAHQIQHVDGGAKEAEPRVRVPA
jgi:hypothetical protein